MNHSIMAQVANEYGDLSYCMKSVEKEYLGVDYNKFFKLVAEKEDLTIPDEASQRCVDLALEKISTMMRKIDGASAVIEKLLPHYKLNVASNANKTIVLESLKAVELDHFFDLECVVAGRAMATPKPAPDLFLLAAEKMTIDPSRCLVIEDSATGVQGARAAGMEVWGFTGVSHDPEIHEKTLKKAGATAVFERFIHIGEALGV